MAVWITEANERFKEIALHNCFVSQKPLSDLTGIDFGCARISISKACTAGNYDTTSFFVDDIIISS